MKDLTWDRVAPVIFFSALTLITGYIGYTLRDLNTNISQLNIQMVTAVERIAMTAKDNETVKAKQEEHTKIIYEIDGRVKVLERTK